MLNPLVRSSVSDGAEVHSREAAEVTRRPGGPERGGDCAASEHLACSKSCEIGPRLVGIAPPTRPGLAGLVGINPKGDLALIRRKNGKQDRRGVSVECTLATP